MKYAPIVLFVYNRPGHTKQTLEALMLNELADQSDLYIYADAAKHDSGFEEKKKIDEVRLLIRKKQWCKTVKIIESEVNKGLANSIIQGVTEIVNEFDKIIVLEDDLVTSPGFLTYMNDALVTYEYEEKVFHVSGYVYPNNEVLPQTFFYNVPLCWGWATWKRAWQYLETDSEKLYNYFEQNKEWTRFNKFGDHWLENQLKDNVSGKLKTWFIKWHSSVMMQKGYCLFPGRSLVNNIGFDGSGLHNSSSGNFTHQDLANFLPIEKTDIKESKVAEKIFKQFYQRLMNEKSNYNTSYVKAGLKGFPFQKPVKKIINKAIRWAFPELHVFKNRLVNQNSFISKKEDLVMGQHTSLYQPYEIYDALIDDYTYVSTNSFISKAIIGKFCSIGPNFMCGRGIHPLNGFSTSPTFYSRNSPNGISFSQSDKIEERKTIVIGNDVFIGANVTILDGVTIGDGAVIGAGAVVSKDIPAYAIAFGSPIVISRFRFTEDQIKELIKIEWWNFKENDLKEAEQLFFDIDAFIKKFRVA